MPRLERVNDLDRKIGQSIRVQRQLAGMTMGKLADRVGLTGQQIQKYETGQNRVAASTLYSIALALDVRWPDLLGYMGKERPPSPGAARLVKIYENLPRQSQLALMVTAKSLQAAEE